MITVWSGAGGTDINTAFFHKSGFFKAAGPVIYPLGAAFISALCSTCRVEVFGGEIETSLLRERKDILFPCWHRGIFYYAYHFKNCGGATLISESKDGEIIARIIDRLGMKSFRGSTTKNGTKAMNDLVEFIKQGHYGGFTPDGPIGPPYVSKPGIIQVAARTGSPLVPFAWDARPSFEFNSWDRFVLPLPFSRIAVVYDFEPMYVPQGLSTLEYEELRKEFDRRMNILNFQARVYVKNRIENMDPRNISPPDNYMEYLPVRNKHRRRLFTQKHA